MRTSTFNLHLNIPINLLCNISIPSNFTQHFFTHNNNRTGNLCAHTHFAGEQPAKWWVFVVGKRPQHMLLSTMIKCMCAGSTLATHLPAHHTHLQQQTIICVSCRRRIYQPDKQRKYLQYLFLGFLWLSHNFNPSDKARMHLLLHPAVKRRPCFMTVIKKRRHQLKTRVANDKRICSQCTQSTAAAALGMTTRRTSPVKWVPPRAASNGRFK